MNLQSPTEFATTWERIDDPAKIREAMTEDQLAEDELASRLVSEGGCDE